MAGFDGCKVSGFKDSTKVKYFAKGGGVKSSCGGRMKKAEGGSVKKKKASGGKVSKGALGRVGSMKKGKGSFQSEPMYGK